MVNRPDINEKKGGDYYQMIETKRYLEYFGLKVSIINDLPPNFKLDYDLIHIFNLQTAFFTWEWVKYCKKWKIPVVLSPIYWKTNPFSFKNFFNYFYKWDKWIWKNFLRSRLEKLERVCSKKYKIQKKILKFSDFILPNSFSELIHIEKKFKLFLQDKSEVIYNGVDYDVFFQIPKCQKENIVIQVAHIGPTKNQLSVIKSLLDVDVPIYFIGRIEDKKYHDVCIKLSKKRKAITYFYGEIKQKELMNIYLKAKVHVLPSFRETPGLVNLEAGAMGCFLVTTTEGSTKEYFGEYAKYVKPFDIQGLKNDILECLKSNFNNGLREHILSNFTWDKSAFHTYKAYEDVLERFTKSGRRRLKDF